MIEEEYLFILMQRGLAVGCSVLPVCVCVCGVCMCVGMFEPVCVCVYGVVCVYNPNPSGCLLCD